MWNWGEFLFVIVIFLIPMFAVFLFFASLGKLL